MLTALTIRDVLLIEALDLDFGSGLTVLTGETGAGKSILLDSLGLALGARADSGLVRAGCEAAETTAAFQVPDAHPARALLAEQELKADDDELMLRRRVKADGGSRAWINDQPVSAALLRDVGAALVEVHGQHDERGLLDAKGHRALLDAFGGLDDVREGVARAYRDWRAAEKTLAELIAEVEAAAGAQEELDLAIEEIAAMAPQPGEEVELAGERATMLAGQKIAEDLTAIDKDIDGSNGGLAKLRSAARRIDRIADAHPLLGEALAALDRALIETDEMEAKLRAAVEALAYDEGRLDEAEGRLFDLRALARKHRVTVDALPDHLEALTARRTRIDAGTAEVEAATKARNAARRAFVEAAEALSAARRDAGARLDAAMAAELPPLKLDAARFRTVVEALDEEQWGPAGADRVAFEISTNPGAPFGPLAKIASGGELSRFVLALKVALAATGEAGTMIFDEIDRGVGGATASAIGDRLARLAAEGQVLVVTHSPQVAARGSGHFRITKSTGKEGAATAVTPISAADRREEIARMLSAADVTEEARAQAARLLG